MVKKAYKVKVAVFTSALDIAQTETKGTVLIKNKDEMLNFTSGEEKHLEKVTIFTIYSPGPFFMLIRFIRRSLKRLRILVLKSLLRDQVLAI